MGPLRLSLLVCVLLALSWHGASGRAFNGLAGLEDTIVDLGDEVDLTHHLYKRSALVDEVMSLSRRVRAIDEHSRSQMVYKPMRVLLSILRILLGGKLKVELLMFDNWDKTIHIDQLFYVKPTNIWQVRQVIMAARTLGLQVRATGAGHSRSPLYVDEGNIMMDVRDLMRHDGERMEYHAPNAERNFPTVTAMTGVYEFELNEFLTEKRVTMLAQPLNDQETVGGMVAASTHGSTWNAPTYSGIVVEMRLMDAFGRLRRFTLERQPEIMKAAICNLGMFGIMYDITMKVEPTWVAKVENNFVKLGDLLLNQQKLRETVTSNFLTEISWFPFNSVTDQQADDYTADGTIPDTWEARNDIVWLRTINRATEGEYRNEEIKGPVYLPTNGSLSGGSIKGLLRGRGAVNFARALEQTSFHYLVNAFPVILPPRWGSETSAAFMLNIDNQFKRVYDAFNFMISRAEAQIKTNGSTPLNAFLPRFFLNHDCFLCPGNNEINMADDSGRTLVIDFLAPPAQYGFYPAAADFLNQFKSEKVRPHWAKRHDNIPGVIEHIQSVYGPLLTGFNDAKRMAQVDNCDMFMNSYLMAVFGRSQNCY